MLGKVAKSFQKGQKGWRIFQGVSAGIGTFLQTLRRVGKVLWLEITGFLFLWLALVGGIACWRLPTVTELISLVDSIRSFRPAIPGWLVVCAEKPSTLTNL